MTIFSEASRKKVGLGWAVWLGWLVLATGCPTTRPVSSSPASSQATKPAAPAPKSAPTGLQLVKIASGFYHSCALRRSGEVLCWGKNTYGELGNGRRQDSNRLVRVRSVNNAVDIAVGRDFSCARLKGGGVACWGNNEDGQLGNGGGLRPASLSLTPVRVGGLRNVSQVVTGEYHACALQRSRVFCWGNAGNGQLGNNAARAFSKPLAIEVEQVKQIASGANHVCALQKTGVVQCWGRNTEGQLGIGKSGSRLAPNEVVNLANVDSIMAAGNHTCATKRGGRTFCWGDSKMGQLGPRAKTVNRVPVAMAIQGSVAQLAGGGRHNCARLQSGRVYCWGANEHGQLGHRATPKFRNQPTVVRGVMDAVDIALGTDHSCGLSRSGQILCWGNPKYGVLGQNRLP